MLLAGTPAPQMNAYSYAHNNRLTKSDPDGEIVSIGAEILAAAPEVGGSYAYAAAQGIIGVAGILLALNFRDSAYRIHSFFMNRGSFGPGPGFSPVAVRLLGAFLGVALIWTCVSILLA